MLNVQPAPPSQPHRRRLRLDRGVRSALVASVIVLLLHLIPLFLPRNMPEQDLAVARAMTDVTQRAAVLRPLRENEKATAAELREAAELLLEAPAEARELAEEAARREPESLETQLLLARLCHRERMDRCEQESLARAERLAPKEARVDLVRADLREGDGDLAGALEAVEQAYRKAPGNLDIALRYGRLLGLQGRSSEAELVLKELEPSLGLPRVLVELGRLKEQQEQPEQARRLFARAVEADPRLKQGYYHLGMVSYQLGDLAGAEQALRAADRLDMSDWRPLAALCAMQMKEGKREAALVTRMDLERRFPERTEVARSACRPPEP